MGVSDCLENFPFLFDRARKQQGRDFFEFFKYFFKLKVDIRILIKSFVTMSVLCWEAIRIMISTNASFCIACCKPTIELSNLAFVFNKTIVFYLVNELTFKCLNQAFSASS